MRLTAGNGLFLAIRQNASSDSFNEHLCRIGLASGEIEIVGERQQHRPHLRMRGLDVRDVRTWIDVTPPQDLEAIQGFVIGDCADRTAMITSPVGITRKRNPLSAGAANGPATGCDAAQ